MRMLEEGDGVDNDFNSLYETRRNIRRDVMPHAEYLTTRGVDDESQRVILGIMGWESRGNVLVNEHYIARELFGVQPRH